MVIIQNFNPVNMLKHKERKSFTSLSMLNSSGLFAWPSGRSALTSDLFGADPKLEALAAPCTTSAPCAMLLMGLVAIVRKRESSEHLRS